MDLVGNFEILQSDDFEKGVSNKYNLFRDARSNKSYNIHPSSIDGFSLLRRYLFII